MFPGNTSNMNNKTPIFLGFISGGAAQIFTEKILTVVVMAFVGALIGWITKELCNYLKSKWIKYKHPKA